MTMKKTKTGNLFWLDDLQWSMLQPHLPTNQTGPKRKDDRLPFVVLMHGCTGLTPLVAKWADEKSGAFLSQGYGVLILNSFGSRNVDKVCGDGN